MHISFFFYISFNSVFNRRKYNQPLFYALVAFLKSERKTKSVNQKLY